MVATLAPFDDAYAFLHDKFYFICASLLQLDTTDTTTEDHPLNDHPLNEDDEPPAADLEVGASSDVEEESHQEDNPVQPDLILRS